MARPLRISFPGALYHVTARGNARQAIVRDDEDRRRFVATVADMIEQYQVICPAWVLMDNHYHLVLETPQANLSSAIRYLNGVYTQAFNRRHDRVGHLFQGRFNAILIEKQTYLLEVCRYVVLNPVRAGLVADPGVWRWSSYRATAGDEPRALWLDVDGLLANFGTRRRAARAAYRQFVAAGMAREQRLWSALRNGVFLGSEGFVEAARRTLGGQEDAEIPAVQRRPTVPALEEVLARTAAAYGVRLDQLLRPAKRPGEARQVAIYLARRAARQPLRAIAARFGMHYAGVSHRVGAVSGRLGRDGELRARVDAILGGRAEVTPIDGPGGLPQRETRPAPAIEQRQDLTPGW